MVPERVQSRLICPLTSCSVEQMRADMHSATQCGADTVECRLDFLDAPPSPEQLTMLLADAPTPVIVTCRPIREGGRFDGDEAQRLELLRRAAKLGATFVDVELDTLPESRPQGDVILSSHDFDGMGGDLDQVAAAMDASSAAVNKLVFTAAACEDSLRAFDVIRACTKPTIALAMGEFGLLSRILARKFGAFGTFAALAAGVESAPGQPTLEAFKKLYRWDDIAPGTTVLGVIGWPVAHSMSPAVHNAAFAAADVDAVYVPLPVRPGADNFNRLIDALLARPWMDWRGLSVTIPHKEDALARVGEENCDELSRKIGAINTITIGPDGELRGDNTDYGAALDALCDAMRISRDGLAGKSAAVLGAGGAARAIVAGLAHCGAEIVIYNRTVARGESLAEEFSCRSAGLDALKRLDAEIVINCTPVGMSPNVDASPLRRIAPCVKVVFDTIYNPIETRLLREAGQAGCEVVSGLDMFLNQAVAQFEIWIREAAPRDVMRKVVREKLLNRRN